MKNILTNKELEIYTYTKKYKNGDIIFNENDFCDHIGIVEKGEIINIIHENEIFGDALVFSSNPVYLGHAICKKETIVRYITRKNLISLFNNNKTFLNMYLNVLSNKLIALKNENKLFKHKNIGDRITHYILEESIGKENGKVYIKNISHFANILSIPRPSLSREISKMINNNFIIKGKDINGVFLQIKKNKVN